jgi:hypothetical protein
MVFRILHTRRRQICVRFPSSQPMFERLIVIHDLSPNYSFKADGYAAA